MMIILLIIVLLFGANKLPKLARSSGQAIGEFSRGRAEMESKLTSLKNDTTNTEEGTESQPETERTSVTK
ncbi:MAG: twin-arginine translocase TatA/TatE family subunit [Halolamina sp.]|uniref:Sec-independent protein translocase subunit TatA/TatB n=1 Tax=Halolamina sp. TaxID=1940283 RepID=UPI002FC2CF76